MEHGIVESFSEPPEGDISNLREAREKLSGISATRGGINVGRMRFESPGAIRERTHGVLREMEGFRHMVGGTDDLLHDTPVECIQAIVEAVKESGRQFC